MASGDDKKLGDLKEILDRQRPRKRADCLHGLRPCPWAGCRYHLFLEVTDAGNPKYNFPSGVEIWELEETCALDIADRGQHTLEEIGGYYELTRERIRQVEQRALKKVTPRMQAFQQSWNGRERLMIDIVIEIEGKQKRLQIDAKALMEAVNVCWQAMADANPARQLLLRYMEKRDQIGRRTPIKEVRLTEADETALFVGINPRDFGDTLAKEVLVNGPRDAFPTFHGHPVVWDAEEFDVVAVVEVKKGDEPPDEDVVDEDDEVGTYDGELEDL